MPDQAAHPFSIRIFVPGGEPVGLRIVEKSNWTGVGSPLIAGGVILGRSSNGREL